MPETFKKVYAVFLILCVLSTFAPQAEAKAILEKWNFEGSTIKGEFAGPEVWGAISTPGANSLIDYPEVNRAASPGNPLLPVEVFDIALPPDADLQSLKINVLQAEQIIQPGYYAIEPAPPAAVSPPEMAKLILDWGENEANILNGKNTQVYSADEWFPAYPVEILETSQMRKWVFVRVAFYPFQYNPVQGKIRTTRRIAYSLDFVRDALTASRPATLSAASRRQQSGSGLSRPAR